MSLPSIPSGFRAVASGRTTLVVREDLADAAVSAGWIDPAGWPAASPSARGGAGRGETRRTRLPDGTRLLLKAMRRGGLTARLWSGRFFGAERLVGNLAVPAEAARRGVPTAAPAALLALEGPRGFFRGWLAVEEIPGASDLLAALASGVPAPADVAAAAAAAVRTMHDAGVEHPDLNLGNLLVRPAEGGPPDAFVIDLDRAEVRPGPVEPVHRRRGLERMERSYLKRFGAGGPLGPDPYGAWVRAYARGEAELESFLRAGRRRARLRLALHRLGWMLGGSAGSRA